MTIGSGAADLTVGPARRAEPVATQREPVVSRAHRSFRGSRLPSRAGIGPARSPARPRRGAWILNRPAIDANAVAATQVADQDAVVSHRQATMPARNLGRVDPDVTLEMPADQEDRTMQDDDRGGSLNQWDESE